MLLERASARKMPLSAYINVVFDELLALKKEVVQKAEKGVVLDKVSVSPMPPAKKYTGCIAFKEYPNIIIRIRDNGRLVGSDKWTMHKIEGTKVSGGTPPLKLPNGNIEFEGYPIIYDQSRFMANGKVLATYEENLEIEWYD